MANILLVTLCLAVLFARTQGCKSVIVDSKTFGSLLFDQIFDLPDAYVNSKSSTGRQVYRSVRPGLPTLYLYHAIINEPEGQGRWVVNTDIGSITHAMAYVQSWSVVPFSIDAVNDNANNRHSQWFIMVPGGVKDKSMTSEHFEVDLTMTVFCSNGISDETFYFDSSQTHQPALSGFYVESYQSTLFKDSSVFSQIQSVATKKQLYMYKITEETWMVGEDPTVNSGLAFITSPAIKPSLFLSHKWRYVTNNPDFIWMWDLGIVVSKFQNNSLHSSSSSSSSSDEINKDTYNYESVYEALRQYRRIKYIPNGQEYLPLRNQLILPSVGLGTGGLNHEDLKDILKKAFNIGYRTFDLAREYGNEHIVASALQENEEVIKREELFLISKVWPTHLGVIPTTDSVHESLHDLKTNYIDSYLLHWPECDVSISWMHCHDTIDPKGNWIQSWRALEREYSEGRIMSIGVSNFDINKLKELQDIAIINPHIVQNHAEPGTQNMDLDVRKFCIAQNIIYQPYAHQRNIQNLAGDVKEILSQLAEMNRKSIHNIASKIFIQTGASIIPRSSNEDHLKQNIDVFSYKIMHADMMFLGWNQGDIEKEANLLRSQPESKSQGEL